MSAAMVDRAWSAYYRHHGTRPILRDRDRVLSNRERLAIWQAKMALASREQRDATPGRLRLSHLPPSDCSLGNPSWRESNW